VELSEISATDIVKLSEYMEHNLYWVRRFKAVSPSPMNPLALRALPLKGGETSGSNCNTARYMYFLPFQGRWHKVPEGCLFPGQNLTGEMPCSVLRSLSEEPGCRKGIAAAEGFFPKSYLSQKRCATCIKT